MTPRGLLKESKREVQRRPKPFVPARAFQSQSSLYQRSPGWQHFCFASQEISRFSWAGNCRRGRCFSVSCVFASVPKGLQMPLFWCPVSLCRVWGRCKERPGGRFQRASGCFCESTVFVTALLVPYLVLVIGDRLNVTRSGACTYQFVCFLNCKAASWGCKRGIFQYLFFLFVWSK